MGELLFLKDETHSIIGSAMNVSNSLGHGFLEKIYENAMVVELRKRGIPFRQQARFTVRYEGEAVGDYIPDLIAYDQIIIEIKAIDRITVHEKAQIMNYLKITKLKIGLIFNFKNTKLEWERIIL